MEIVIGIFIVMFAAVAVSNDVEQKPANEIKVKTCQVDTYKKQCEFKHSHTKVYRSRR